MALCAAESRPADNAYDQNCNANEEPMSDNRKEYPRRLSVQITDAMDDRLEQVARSRDEAKSEVVRAALRTFLDEQEDVIGSRKHFTKMFQRRVDYQDWLRIVTLNVLLRAFPILLSTALESRFDESDLLSDVLARTPDKGERLHAILGNALYQKAKKDEPPA
jgi:Arc/MetJ-type ribon-helix-helix transcriptional regulator